MDDPLMSRCPDALRRVADSAFDRVAVLDRDFNVMYATVSTWSAAQTSPDGRRMKCYEVLLHTPDPCKVCPAAELFRRPALGMPSDLLPAETSACGMHRAVPMMSSRGDVASVLVLLGTPSWDRAVGATFFHADSPNLSAPSDAACLDGLIGQSAAMQQVFHLIRMVADCSVPVLIHGESGTGKELVAQTIHRLSARRAKPFVVVDCGALPETLLESELFGHVKGAFTGASAHKRGLLEEADGGTLFLDEISNTTPAFQARLLRVLQEGEVRRVGSNRLTKIDVRVISATNVDLAELVAMKRFRQDLYYRLAVLPVSLPPLRDRKTDIPLLAAHFLAASCRRHRRALPRVARGVLQALMEASWPGNVRQLQHYIERAVITSGGLRLLGEPAAPTPTTQEAEALRLLVRKAAGQVERDGIIAALRRANGNRARAARTLRISRANLYNKLRAYQIT